MSKDPSLTPKIVRHEGPLLDARSDPTLEGNICTPSVVALPNWAWERQPDLFGSGRIALFFAHHTGKGIRLAVADKPEGPWRVISMASPGLAETPFAMEDPPLPDGEPLDWMNLSSAESRLRAGLRLDGPPWRMIAHIASPDVHVDEEGEQLWMTYHGLLPDGEQITRFATSPDGLFWEAGTAETALSLGPPYFRGFEGPDGARYALAIGGDLLRAETPEGPYEAGPCLVPPSSEGCRVRHIEGHVRGDVLHLFYSRIGDAPERLYHAYVQMAGEWRSWRMEGETVLLSPETPWEGGDAPVTESKVGCGSGKDREVRDPCVFVMPKGGTYLFYCGAGEGTLCLAELVWD